MGRFDIVRPFLPVPRVRICSASAVIRLISSAHDGRSPISPVTWPADIRPRSGRPSTMAARSSIGVFAAISTWAQLSSLPRRMARPCRISSAQLSPDRPRNAAALRTDRARPGQPPGLLQPLHQRRAQHPVRHPVHPRGDHRAGHVAGQVHLLDLVGHRAVAGQQEPGAHRDPGRAVAERGGQPAAIEEPARRDHRHVHRVHHLRDEQAGRHRAGVPATLGAGRDHRVDAPGGHLFRVPPRADRGDRDHPGVAQPADQLRPRRARERGHRHLLLDDQLDPLGRVGRVRPQVHRERRIRPFLDCLYCRTQLAATHRRRRDHTQPARA